MTLKVGIFSKPDTLNILGFRIPAANWFNCAINRSLTVRPTEDDTYEPVAVEAIPSFKDGSIRNVEINGKRFVQTDWKIRDGIYWGDGIPLTGHDYKFTFETSQHPLSGATDPDANETISHIEVDPVNPRRFSIFYKTLNWNFFMRVGRALPAHIEAPIWNTCLEQGTRYQERTEFKINPTNPALYCGPYVVGDYDDEGITLIRNKHWKGKVAQSTIHVIFLKSVSDPRILSLDVLGSPLAHNHVDDAFPILDKTHDLFVRNGYWVTRLAMNMQEGVCSDFEVRRTIKAALDKLDLSQVVAGKWSYPSKSLLSRNLVRQVERARNISNTETIRVFENLKIPLHLFESPRSEAICNAITNALSPFGIILEPIFHGIGQYFSKLFSGTFQGIFLFSLATPFESLLDEEYGSGSVPDLAKGTRGENVYKWQPADLIDCVESLATTTAFEERVALYQSFEQLLARDIPAIPLAYGPQAVFARKGMSGLKAPIGPYGETVDIEHWQ